MRWLNKQDRDDSGVVALTVVLTIPLLLLAAALAIDVNRFSQEVASAQHSADATALAVATDCVLGSPLGAYEEYRKPPEQVISDGTPIACGTNQVKITIEKDVNRGLVLDRNARQVSKSATVRWGALTGANIVPFVISDCEFREPALNETIILYLDDTKPQSGCSSLPGGFSQLARDGCSTPVSAGGEVDGVTGVGGLQNKVACITNPDPSAPPLPHVVFIPIYDTAECLATDCKGKGPYLIKGFAALEITGYSFTGNVFGGSLDRKCPDEKDRGMYCIQGRFIEYVTSTGTSDPLNPSPDFGLSLVFLSS